MVAYVDILDAWEVCALPSKASTVYERGDILYWDETNKWVAPITSYTWATSDIATQKAIARSIIGICNSSKLSTDASQADVEVVTRGRFSIPLDTATSLTEGRTLLAPDGNGSSTLVDQAVEDVTDPRAACFIAVKTTASATKAVCVLYKPEIKRICLTTQTKHAGAGDWVTDMVLGVECTVFGFEGIVNIAIATNDLVLNLEKNTTNITGNLTCAQSGSAVGQVNYATLTATDFNTTDTLSVEQSSSIPTAGNVTVHILTWQHPSMKDLVRVTN